MIKWHGKNTHGNINKYVEARTMQELYNELVARDYISRIDYEPLDRYILERAGKDYFQITDEIYKTIDESEVYLEYNNLFYDYCEKNNIDTDLSEKDYMLIISKEKGNYYYQDFTDENGDEINL